ncbi:purine-cytosine permease family protein [Rhodococcus sp. MSC1_016]|jgi:purine-cytosine permease-like protein|uniref:purine-cytosine permease family protein n=1 Tax=Rhodococcus sp. MSC1_016 TaxID=2909266 RepID=UPI00203082F1|nr:cytosine permease [Rhodococcus sp. MSC1_016]
MTLSADPSKDRAGQIEEAGVEFIPEEARDSSPLNVFAVFLGANLSWTVAIYGWIAVGLGLDFWPAVLSSTVGTLIGALFIMPVTLMGPRTGTNMTVSSGAHFGIRGRIVGSGLALVFALMFAALTVWTSGDAIVAASHRLFGTPEGNGALAVSYAIVTILMITAALYGHATIVAMQKFCIPIALVIIIAGFFVYKGTFQFHQPHDDGFEYALGSFWKTCILSVVISIAGPISYAPAVGDYTRRLSRRYSDGAVSGSVGLGLFVGIVLPVTFGCFTAMAFTNPTNSFLGDLVMEAPGWYVLPILVLAVLGGFGQGVLCIYSSGLDLESFFPRLRRLHTTAIAAASAVVLLYLGVFVVDAVQSITDATVILNAVATPWVAVLVIGVLRRRRHLHSYDANDLQAFAQGRRGGRYWFVGGWNIPAVVAWCVGSVFGVLSVHTSTFQGPLSHLANGVDLSVVGSGAIAAALYLGALAIWPKSVETPELAHTGPSDAGLCPAAHMSTSAE